MSSNTETDKEFRISLRFPLPCSYDKIKKLKNCQRLFLFQKLNEQGEEIKESIFNKTNNKVLRKFMYQLEILYFQYDKQMEQSANTYLNKDNIISLFLLSTQIEIDVPQFQMTSFILPIAFQTYVSQIQYQTPGQNQYKLLQQKICEDFEINYIENNKWKSVLDFYELLIFISKNPVSQKNQEQLKQFQDFRNLIQIEHVQQEPKEVYNHNNPEKQPLSKQDKRQVPIIFNSLNSSAKQLSLSSQSTQNTSQIDANQIHKAINDTSPSIIIDNLKKVDSIFYEPETVKTESITIVKVKHMQSLIRQQNQEIILSRCSKSMIPLGKDNIIFYNQKYDVKLQKQYNKRILYIGELDYNYEQQGIGLFRQIDLKVQYEGQFDYGLQSGFGRQTNLNQSYEGTFIQGQKQGFIIITELRSQQIFYTQFEYDNQKQYFQDEQSFIYAQQQQMRKQNLIEKEIIESKTHVLSNVTLKTLSNGQWLQEKIIDYYLDQMQNHYKQLHKNQVNYTIFNTMNSQDIFSSNLDYNENNFTTIEKRISLNLLKQFVDRQQVNKNFYNTKNSEITRTIYAINLNRSHFITIAIEGNTIYILNSLSSNLAGLCETFKQAYKKIGIDLQYNPNAYEIQIHQQQDYYSCGVQTCYVINQLIKNHNVSVKNIQFNNTTTEIQNYTTHMRNVILTKKSIHINRQIQ